MDRSTRNRWIRILRNANDPLRREAAAKALAATDDDESFSALTAALHDEHLYVCRAAAETLATRVDRRAIQPLVDAFHNAIAEKKMSEAGDFAKALAQLGAVEAIPTLLAGFQASKFYRTTFEEALAAFGARGVNLLVQALDTHDERIRLGVATALGKTGAPALPALLEALDAGSTEVRVGAAAALGKSGSTAACGPLMDALRSDEPALAEAAARALGHIGDRAAAPALVEMLTGPAFEPIRVAVVEALGELKSPETIPALLPLLADDTLRSVVERSLERFGSSVVEPLLSILAEDDAAVRAAAGRVLARRGAEAVPGLVTCLDDERWFLREAAASSLGQLWNDVSWRSSDVETASLFTAVTALVQVVSDVDGSVRAAAAASLGALGRIARSRAADKARFARAESGPDDETARLAFSQLEAALRDSDFRVRAAAATALGRLGEPAAAQILLNRARLRQPDRAAAVRGLVRMGDDAVPTIVEGLHDADPTLRRLIARGIRQADEPDWFHTMKDYATVYVPDSVTTIVAALSEHVDDPDEDVREAVSDALSWIRARLRYIRVEGDLNIFYAPHDLRPSALHLELEEEIAAAAALAAAPRYADVHIFDNGGDMPPESPLVVGRWYRLEVVVRSVPTGLPGDPRREPIREPGATEDLKLMVTAEADGFQIEEPVQSLILPPSGDTPEPARFRLRPLPEAARGTARLCLRLYCQLSLLALVKVTAKVMGPLDEPTSTSDDSPAITLVEDRLGPGLVPLDTVVPRAINIAVSREEHDGLLRFTIFDEQEQNLTLSAPLRFGDAELEDLLLTTRTLWSDIALSNPCVAGLSCDQDEFVSFVRRLAAVGRRLWTKLFRSDIGSAMHAVGKWLEEHPLADGSLVQVAFEDKDADLLFPWALLYDRPIPPERYKLPDVNGFWGMRYSIEQRPYGSRARGDGPVTVADQFRLSVMLWDQFRNTKEHLRRLESVTASDRVARTTPPITQADVFIEHLSDCACHLLYFYTHGHTRTRRTAVGVQEGLDVFVRRYQAWDPSDPRREMFRPLYEAIQQAGYDDARSWIELSYGKLYLDELYEFDSPLDTHPLVFLNMCESAQVTPSLSDSFIHFFINRGAASVIGTECPMSVEFAHPFALWCLEAIVSGASVGEAILGARRRAMEARNPLGLAYTLFGSATLRFEPPLIGQSAVATGGGT